MTDYRFADIQLLRYEVPGFTTLPLRQKLLGDAPLKPSIRIMTDQMTMPTGRLLSSISSASGSPMEYTTTTAA